MSLTSPCKYLNKIVCNFLVMIEAENKLTPFAQAFGKFAPSFYILQLLQPPS